MSYQSECDQFIDRMTREGLSLQVTRALLRAATTIQRYAELACSSESADRDRVPCPRAKAEKEYATKPIAVATAAFARMPCLCDQYNGTHQTIPRIVLQEDRLVSRLKAAIPADWQLDTQGDPRGYTLRVIPPSYAERNTDRDRFNRETIGVPSGDTRVRF